MFAHARHWKAYLRKMLRPFITGRVLEVGAGLGATTAVLATLPHSGWTCLEPDPDLAAALGRELANRNLPPVELRCRCVADLVDVERYDTILYIDVLEHIADHREELARAARCLRPGGHLVVLAPAHPWLYSAFDSAVGHHRRYQRRSLAAITPDGLAVVRALYLDSVGLLASLANRCLMRQSQPTAAQIAFWDGALVPLSRYLDPLLGYRLGKTILTVWQADLEKSA